MKKISLLSVLMLMTALISFTSCGNDDTPAPSPAPSLPPLTEVFSIEGANFVNAAFPEATTTATIEGLTVNTSAINGGQNLVTISTSEEYQQFYIGTLGNSGYYEVTPVEASSARTRAGGTVPVHTLSGYLIPLRYSLSLNGDIDLIIAAKNAAGQITAYITIHITFVTTGNQPGDLNVSLVFENEKDVDLHLYTPSGTHIYYGNPGGSYVKADGTTAAYGLDLDSNPACHIDGVKNENIFIPESLVEDGEYTVVVDMYSNCDPSISTQWSVVAYFKGEVLTNTIGENPVSGTYPVNAPNSDMTPIMKFNISTAAAARMRGGSSILWDTFKPYKPTDIGQIKLEEAGN